MNHQKIRCFAIAAAICFVWFFAHVSPASAQTDKQKKIDKNQPPLEIKANVMALDAAGQYADDVKIEDLKIFESGVEQKIVSFEKKEPVLNVGFAADNSGSLRPRLETVIRAGRVLTANLRADDAAFVVRFVGKDKIEVLQDWTLNKSALATAFDNMYPEGGLSAITDAILFAAEKAAKRGVENKTIRRALVVITDGDERDSRHKLDDALARIKAVDTQVFVLTLTGDLDKNLKQKAERFVQTIALETGGRAFNIEGFGGDETIVALKSLVVELRSQYVVSYISTNPNRDGLPRKLTVQIADDTKGGKRRANIRDGFVVPKN